MIGHLENFYPAAADGVFGMNTKTLSVDESSGVRVGLKDVVDGGVLGKLGEDAVGFTNRIWAKRRVRNGFYIIDVDFRSEVFFRGQRTAVIS